VSLPFLPGHDDFASEVPSPSAAQTAGNHQPRSGAEYVAWYKAGLPLPPASEENHLAPDASGPKQSSQPRDAQGGAR
jgi:hypothetical protein